jgi:mono/diheme cytochrome c family protein
MTAVRILVAVFLLIAALAAVLLLSGVYNVGADAPHWPWVERLAEAVRKASIASRVDDLHAPDLTQPQLIAEGAEHYAAMCPDCHLAPGIEQSDIRKGLYPRPPDLRKDMHADPNWQFWVVKHGIKMSAMPAWGATHDDQAIWGIVAFLQKLPSLSVEQYQQLTGNRVRATHGAEHHHDAGDSSAPEEHSGGAHHH